MLIKHTQDLIRIIITQKQNLKLELELKFEHKTMLKTCNEFILHRKQQFKNISRLMSCSNQVLKNPTRVVSFIYSYTL